MQASSGDDNLTNNFISSSLAVQEKKIERDIFEARSTNEGREITAPFLH